MTALGQKAALLHREKQKGGSRNLYRPCSDNYGPYITVILQSRGYNQHFELILKTAALLQWVRVNTIRREVTTTNLNLVQ